MFDPLSDGRGALRGEPRLVPDLDRRPSGTPSAVMCCGLARRCGDAGPGDGLGAVTDAPGTGGCQYADAVRSRCGPDRTGPRFTGEPPAGCRRARQAATGQRVTALPSGTRPDRAQPLTLPAARSRMKCRAPNRKTTSKGTTASSVPAMITE